MNKRHENRLRVLIIVLGCLLVVGISSFFWPSTPKQSTPSAYAQHSNATLGITYAIPSDMQLESEDTSGEIAVIMFSEAHGRRIAIYRQKEVPGKPIDTGIPPSWIRLSEKEFNGTNWKIAVADKSKSFCDEKNNCGLIARIASTTKNGYNYRISYASTDNTNETFEHLIESFSFTN